MAGFKKYCKLCDNEEADFKVILRLSIKGELTHAEYFQRINQIEVIEEDQEAAAKSLNLERRHSAACEPTRSRDLHRHVPNRYKVCAVKVPDN